MSSRASVASRFSRRREKNSAPEAGAGSWARGRSGGEERLHPPFLHAGEPAQRIGQGGRLALEHRVEPVRRSGERAEPERHHGAGLQRLREHRLVRAGERLEVGHVLQPRLQRLLVEASPAPRSPARPALPCACRCTVAPVHSGDVRGRSRALRHDPVHPQQGVTHARAPRRARARRPASPARGALRGGAGARAARGSRLPARASRLLRPGSDSHQLMPISFALSTEAISRRSLMVSSSMSSRLIWMSPAMTMPLSSTRSRMSARFVVSACPGSWPELGVGRTSVPSPQRSSAWPRRKRRSRL